MDVPPASLLFAGLPEMAPEASGAPESKQISVKIGENQTEIILTPFSNCIFILITQVGKIGTLVSKTSQYSMHV